jgi:hypothetical protein
MVENKNSIEKLELALKLVISGKPNEIKEAEAFIEEVIFI